MLNKLKKIKIIPQLTRFKPKIKQTNLNPYKHDLNGINNRMYKAMIKLGITELDIANLCNIDEHFSLSRPTIENIIKLSNFMGVSVRWLMCGEPENTIDMFVMGQQTTKQNNAAAVGTNASTGSAIITGTRNSTIIVQNIQNEQNNLETELLQSFRKLSSKEKILVIAYSFALENNKELKKQPPS